MLENFNLISCGSMTKFTSMIPWGDVNGLAVMDGFKNGWACRGVLCLRVGFQERFILQ